MVNPNQTYFNNVCGRIPDPQNPGKKRSIFQSEILNIPHEEMEIETCMEKGLIHNWDLFEEVIEHVLSKRIVVDSQYHPIMFTEQVSIENLNCQENTITNEQSPFDHNLCCIVLRFETL